MYYNKELRKLNDGSQMIVTLQKPISICDEIICTQLAQFLISTMS
jgi:hypothetical protein